ncbi:hypothetical protein WOLCODRAFT_154032 [Wolfiporia cocos MD-104 SS10]|uniref:dUTP diphosphatase n=1 Tax=Wolfiporia cocos (strain MD-104) TaxID=742152 RepID=A0A2H3JVH2_WOLCO|nr:hypothetical protein WOLCODRAFT_154032 [Wolfiporia cocos MD-104 SS10]
MAHNLEFIRGPHNPTGNAHPPAADENMSNHTPDPFNGAFMDDFGMLSIHDSIHTPTPSVHTATIGEDTYHSVGSIVAQFQGLPSTQLNMAFQVAQNQSATVRGGSQLGPPIQSPLAVQWAFPLNLQSQGFGLACQQVATTMIQTGVWSREMAGWYLREAQRVQADTLQAGDVASLHSRNSVHATVSPMESRFWPIENWVRSMHMYSPQWTPGGPRPLPTPPAQPSLAGTRQTNPFLPGYTPLALMPLAPAPPVPPQNVHVNTWGAMPLQETQASMWRPERPATSEWNTYSILLEPRPDPRYKSKVREPGDFDSSGFTNWYMRLKLYINDNAPLLFSDSKRVGTTISMISGKAVNSWKFDDPDLEKKAAVAAEKLSMQAGKGEDYFQELERLLMEAKYNRENQVVHRWITLAIPKEIYSAVHQAFITTTVNDKLQHGYNKVVTLDIYLDHPRAILPEHKSEGAAGYDLYSAEEVLVPNGKRVDVEGSVVDEDYTSRLKVILNNQTGSDFQVEYGDRITQFILECNMTPDTKIVKLI